jgi:dTDP-4-amino-4,6-dideoxygalactose transaminase
VAAFLFAQLENIREIQNRRIDLWNSYYKRMEHLEQAGHLKRPVVPDFATQNGHMFYLVCKDLGERTRLIDHLKSKSINSVFHYISLHHAPYFKENHDGRPLTESDRFTDCLVRLPLFFELETDQVHYICDQIEAFYKG